MKKIASILGLILLTSCGVQPVTVNAVSTQLSVIQPAAPTPVTVVNPQWFVITTSNAASVLSAEAKAENSTDAVLIAVTPTDFNNILLNFNDTTRFIKQQDSIISYYESALKSQQKVTSTTNKTGSK
jgi:hypothetical protein